VAADELAASLATSGLQAAGQWPPRSALRGAEADVLMCISGSIYHLKFRIINYLIYFIIYSLIRFVLYLCLIKECSKKLYKMIQNDK
jgi:hypothetical protein